MLELNNQYNQIRAKVQTEVLVRCGIMAIWNFAPKDLKLSERVVVQRTDLATSFAVLSAKEKRKISDEDIASEVDEW